MYVCHCYAVTRRQVSDAVRGGAFTVEALAAARAAGSGCSRCQPSLEALLACAAPNCRACGPAPSLLSCDHRPHPAPA